MKRAGHFFLFYHSTNDDDDDDEEVVLPWLQRRAAAAAAAAAAGAGRFRPVPWRCADGLPTVGRRPARPLRSSSPSSSLVFRLSLSSRPRRHVTCPPRRGGGGDDDAPSVSGSWKTGISRAGPKPRPRRRPRPTRSTWPTYTGRQVHTCVFFNNFTPARPPAGSPGSRTARESTTRVSCATGARCDVLNTTLWGRKWAER